MRTLRHDLIDLIGRFTIRHCAVGTSVQRLFKSLNALRVRGLLPVKFTSLRLAETHPEVGKPTQERAACRRSSDGLEDRRSVDAKDCRGRGEAERLVKAFVGQNVEVVTRLRTATPQQVYLQVRIAEVSRTLARDIGTNLLSRDSTGGFLFGLGRGSPGTITNVESSNPRRMPVTTAVLPCS